MLTAIQSPGSWGLFTSVYQLPKLKNLVIDIGCDLLATTCLIRGLGSLPPTTMEIVFVAPVTVLLTDRPWWSDLDRALLSLGLPRSNAESKLRFCMFSDNGDVNVGPFPLFGGREEVMVDRTLKVDILP